VVAWALAACATSGPAPAAGNDPLLESALVAEGIDPATSALVIYRIEDEKTWMSGGTRVFARFTPASTSKIPHTLLALESGVISGPDEVFRWDGTRHEIDGWNETQTFRTAFARSTVWIYQIVVPKIGAARLTDWLSSFGYGNADIGEPGDLRRYWLQGPLAISAAEQVAFLSRLARRTLPLTANTYVQGLPMMEAGRGEGWVMYAKTGWKRIAGETDLGWYVGWIEQTSGDAPGTYVFALNMDMDGSWDDANRRRPAVFRALAAIGALAPVQTLQ
jgi:beta-lactamase class D